MLQSIEERMEDQLLEKERERFTDEPFLANWASKVNNHYDEPGQYTSEDFKADFDRLSEENSQLWVSDVKNKILLDSILETLSDVVKSYPNDQELGAAIRKWYNQTEGKFI